MADQDIDRTVRYAALYALSEHYNRHPDTLPSLRRHAVEGPSNFERASALSGLAKYFNDDRTVLEVVCGQALHDPDKFPRTVAIKGLGEYFRNRQDTLPLLVSAARGDPSPEPGDEQYADSYYCREAAITALAKYWPAEEIALECIRDVSQTDKVEWMRSAAATWLSSITTEAARATRASLA